MENKYCIRSYLDDFQGVALKEIEKEEYVEVRQAYNLCLKNLWLEEKYRILIENYYEFEKEIVNIYEELTKATDDKIKELGANSINIMNRRLLNLLSSSRMYIDQLQHDLSTISTYVEDKNILVNIRKLMADIYDENIGYQLMEFIRNYTQHKNLCLRSIFIIKPLSNNKEIEFCPIMVEFKLSELKCDNKFDNKIKKKHELIDISSDDLNIIPFVRNYIRGLEKVHIEYKKTITKHIDLNMEIINKMLIKYDKVNDINFGGVAFIETDIDSKDLNWVNIEVGYIKRMKQYEEFKSAFSKNKYYLNKFVFKSETQIKSSQLGLIEKVRIRQNDVRN